MKFRLYGRLLDRHHGPLPREVLVRLWREMVGAGSLLQTNLKIAVTAPPEGGSGLIYLDLAKDYFSSVIPMQRVANPLAALSLVRDGEVTLAVLPRPRDGEADGEANGWWQSLLEPQNDNPLRIVARLPLGDRSSLDANPEFQSFVVARLRFQPSGDDRSCLALRLNNGVSRARIVDQLKAQDIIARQIYTANGADNITISHLIEVDGYIAADDPRLRLLLGKLDPAGQAIIIGGYPTPPVYNDRIGKNAPNYKSP